MVAGSSARGETMSAKSAVIDDLSREPSLSAIGTRWQLFTDGVMGGVSNGTMVREGVVTVTWRVARKLAAQHQLRRLRLRFATHAQLRL